MFIWTIVDANRDERLDLNEFRNLIAQNFGANATEAIYTGGEFEQVPFATSAYETSSAATYGDFTGGHSEGYGAVSDLGTAYSYDQSSVGGIQGEYEANIGSNSNLTAASSSSYEASSSQTNVQQYATNAQGLFQDPNPQVIRRPAQGGQVTYTQNIRVRFLQPPPIPPPGVNRFSRENKCRLNSIFHLAIDYQRSSATSTATTSTAYYSSTSSSSSTTASTRSPWKTSSNSCECRNSNRSFFIHIFAKTNCLFFSSYSKTTCSTCSTSFSHHRTTTTTSA